MVRRNNKGDDELACCISPPNGIKIIAITSCASGAVITFITWISCYLLREGTNSRGLGAPIIGIHFAVLLFIGISQTSTSIWLLMAQEKRLAAKVWTIFHILSATAIVVFFWNLLFSDALINSLVKTFFSFIGINLCLTTFNVLVMIEFLIRPPSDETFRSIPQKSSSLSRLAESRGHWEYKV